MADSLDLRGLGRWQHPWLLLENGGHKRGSPMCVVVVGLCGVFFANAGAFLSLGGWESLPLFPVPVMLMEMGGVECEVHEQSKRDLF